MADIQLDAGQVRDIAGYNSRKDFPGGYAYISSIITQHPEFDQSTAFWFEKARLINLNIRSDPADVYIRSVTACGLRWDSKMGDNRVVNARMLQQTSDNIAQAVLGQVVISRAITNVNIFLNQDIIGALASGQTIGGWGGAFYYWNAPYVPDGAAPTTVGQYILSHPAEREKFVACNANASLDAVLLTRLPGLEPSVTIPGRLDDIALARLKLLMNGLATNRQAQAPQFIKDEIRDRAAAIILGRSAAGDPNQIGDAVFNGKTWFAPQFQSASGMLATLPAPVRDPNVVGQLDAGRGVRQAHQAFRPVPAY